MNIKMLNKTFEKILDRICDADNNDDFDEIIIRLYKFYLVNDRHNYSCISKYIETKYIEDEQSLAYLLFNLEQLVSIVDNTDVLKLDTKFRECYDNLENKNNVNLLLVDKFIDKLKKLYDHVMLEQDRMQFSKNNQDRLIETSKNKINEAMSEFKEYYDTKSDSLNTNMLTTIGLFSAIIFVFFGGVTSLSSFVSAFSNINSDHEHVLYGIFIIAIVLFDVVFLLLYSISKMTDKQIGRVISDKSENYYIHYWDKQLKEEGYLNNCGEFIYYNENKKLTKEQFKERKKEIYLEATIQQKLISFLQYIGNFFKWIYFKLLKPSVIIPIKRFPYIVIYNCGFLIAIICTYLFYKF